MFHHFHDKNHVKGQGSISNLEFKSIIDFYCNNFNLLSAEIIFDKFILGKLNKDDICITFDDNLKCQYDIALPVLNDLKIKAFWFIYSSPLDGSFEKLETLRYYRSFYFKSFLEFYNSFFKELKSDKKYDYVFKDLNGFDFNNYLNDFSFYTKEDKIFRYTRDILLGENKYFEIMNSMMKKSKVSLNTKLHKKLWMSTIELQKLKNDGHIIGLHSHTHPTKMSEKSYKFQYSNYQENKLILENIINENIITMSHPCNSYNNYTLEILKKLDIKLGFRANLVKGYNSEYEIPRIDHSEILKLL